MAKREARPEAPAAAVEVGYLEAFDRDGNVIYDEEGFVAGRSTVPFGVSVAMGAMRITDPRSKRVIRKWDPWGVLAELG